MLKYSFADFGRGMHPQFNKSSSSNKEVNLMPVPSLEGGSLRLQIDKRPGSGLHFDAEVSGNLKDWNRSERRILRDDEEAFYVRDRVGLRESSSRFLRMTVHPLK